ncbi:hypothetical protein CR513_07418, partial [Mucuna pruriens]
MDPGPRLTLAYLVVGGPSWGIAGSSAQGNQSPGRAASQTSSPLSNPSSSSSSGSTPIWYRDNSEDDLSTDPYSWVDLEVKKVFSTFTRGGALSGTAKVICQPGPWSVTVRPCRPDEPAHVRPASSNPPSFFLYDTLPFKLGIKLHFTSFERSVLRALNVAPTQLHPNSWGFVRAFELICEDLGRAPSLSSAKVGWTSLSSRPKRKLLKPFLESFKVFKDRFFKVSRGAGGPDILTPQPAVSVTVSVNHLEEWEKEFVAELHGLRVLSTAEIIKGTGFSVKYLKNVRKKISQASPAEPNDSEPLDSPSGSPFQTGPIGNEEADRPHSTDTNEERPQKRLHAEFDDLFDDPAPVPNEEEMFSRAPVSPSLWDHSTSMGQVGSLDASLASDRSRVQRLGVKGTLNIFHQLAGCSLIFARAAEAEFGGLDDQITSLSDQLAQAQEKNDGMTAVHRDSIIKIGNYERTVDGLQGELRQASHQNEELLAAKSALEAERESLNSKIEDLSLSCQQLEATNVDSLQRLSLMESELAKIRGDSAAKDATILKQGSSILQQYEVGFHRALAQVKVLCPDLDVAEADPYKDIVDGRLVDVPTPPDSPVA